MVVERAKSIFEIAPVVARYFDEGRARWSEPSPALADRIARGAL